MGKEKAGGLTWDLVEFERSTVITVLLHIVEIPLEAPMPRVTNGMTSPQRSAARAQRDCQSLRQQ